MTQERGEHTLVCSRNVRLLRALADTFYGAALTYLLYYEGSAYYTGPFWTIGTRFRSKHTVVAYSGVVRKQRCDDAHWGLTLLSTVG